MEAIIKNKKNNYNVETLKEKYSNKDIFSLQTGEATTCAYAFKNGDIDAGNILFKGIKNLKLGITKKFIGLTKFGYSVEDILEICNESVMKAVFSFDFNRDTEFTTYVTTCMRTDLKRTYCNEIRKRIYNDDKLFEIKSLDDNVFNKSDSGNEITYHDTLATNIFNELIMIDRLSKSEIISKLESLPPKYEFVLIKHYFEGVTQTKLAQDLGVSREYVKNLIKEAKAEIKRQLTKPNDEPAKLAFGRKKVSASRKQMGEE